MGGGHTPLGQSLLTLFGRAKGEEGGPWAIQPWSSSVWREIAGLVPLREGDTLPDGQECADVSDGFRLTQKALLSLTDAGRKAFSADKLAEAQGFLDLLWGRILHALQNGHQASTALSKPTVLRGSSAYQAAITTMISRPGGVMTKLEEVLEAGFASPRHVWIGERALMRHTNPDADLNEVPIPAPGAYVNSTELRTAGAIRLFGYESLNPYTGIVQPDFGKVVACLFFRLWEKLSRRLLGAIKKSKTEEKAFGVALESASKDPTPTNLRALTRVAKRYRDAVTSTGQVMEAEFKERERAIESLWDMVRSSQDTETTGARVMKGKNVSLPSEEEVAAVFAYYSDDYCQSLKQHSEELLVHLEQMLTLNPECDQGLSVDLREGCQDIGADAYAHVTLVDLWSLLGLSGKSVFPWGNAGGVESTQSLLPKWHQVVGTLFMLAGVYTKKLGDLPRPTLLCDDVGVGKTLQLIGLICMVVHLYEQQVLNAPPPPFVKIYETPYFAGLKEIPNLPFIIMVPRTLSAQWQQQLALFTLRGSFNVVVYSSTGAAGQNVIKPGTHWKHALQPYLKNSRPIIVIAEFSALAAEARRVLVPRTYSQSKADRKLLARGDPPELRPGIMPETTIMGQSFTGGIMDESHQLRNHNMTTLGVSRVGDNCLFNISVTATPVFTGPKDLTAQGRLVHCPGMTGDAGEELWLAMDAAERQRSQEWSANCQHNESTVESTQEAKAGINKVLSGKRKAEHRALFIAQGPIEVAKEMLMPIVLRRTRDSVDPDGKKILSLPPYLELICWIPLSNSEREGMEEMERRLAGGELIISDGRSGRAMLWADFLTNQRNWTFHSEIVPLKEREKEESLPEGTLTSRMADEWNAENIDAKLSTRMQALARLLEHYLTPGAKPTFFNRDGSRDLEAEAELKENLDPSDKPRKVLLFVVFGLHRDLTKKLLDIKGHRYIEYHGGMTSRARERAVTKFETDDEIRIMIISNVGSTGLNLMVASVVIFVNGVWSGQERRQIIGRLWRYGQGRHVIVIDMRAPDTVDEILAAYADGKTMMSDEFLSRQRLVMEHIHNAPEEDHFDISDSPLPMEEYDDDDEDDTRPVVAATKVQSRQRKDGATIPGAKVPLPPVPAQSSKRRKTGDSAKSTTARKRKTTVDSGSSSKKQKSGTKAPESSLPAEHAGARPVAIQAPIAVPSSSKAPQVVVSRPGASQEQTQRRTSPSHALPLSPATVATSEKDEPASIPQPKSQTKPRPKPKPKPKPEAVATSMMATPPAEPIALSRACIPIKHPLRSQSPAILPLSLTPLPASIPIVQRPKTPAGQPSLYEPSSPEPSSTESRSPESRSPEPIMPNAASHGNPRRIWDLPRQKSSTKRNLGQVRPSASRKPTPQAQSTVVFQSLPSEPILHHAEPRSTPLDSAEFGSCSAQPSTWETPTRTQTITEGGLPHPPRTSDPSGVLKRPEVPVPPTQPSAPIHSARLTGLPPTLLLSAYQCIPESDRPLPHSPAAPPPARSSPSVSAVAPLPAPVPAAQNRSTSRTGTSPSCVQHSGSLSKYVDPLIPVTTPALGQGEEEMLQYLNLNYLSDGLSEEELQLQIDLGFGPQVPAKNSPICSHQAARPAPEARAAGPSECRSAAPPPFGAAAASRRSIPASQSSSSSSHHSGSSDSRVGNPIPSTAPSSSTHRPTVRRVIATGEFARAVKARRLEVSDSGGNSPEPRMKPAASSSSQRTPQSATAGDTRSNHGQFAKPHHPQAVHPGSSNVASSSQPLPTPASGGTTSSSLQPPPASSSTSNALKKQGQFAKPRHHQAGVPAAVSEGKRKAIVLQAAEDELEQHTRTLAAGPQSPHRKKHRINLPVTRTDRG